MKNKSWISIILIIILGCIVYANSMGGKFLYDDERLVKNNVYIKQWSNLPRIFTEDIGAGAGSVYFHYNFYRPIQMLTYMVDYSMWGTMPFGYHLTSILLHIAVAVAIYFLIGRIFDNKTMAFFTSILFMAHPLHTEAVSYISGRADLLAALFILLCLVFYVKDLAENSPECFIMTIASYILACLSKEYSLITIFLILLYHYTFGRKIRWHTFGSIIAVTAIYIFLRLTVFNFPVVYQTVHGSFFERLPGFFVAFFGYLRLLILPFGLHMEYGTPFFSFIDPRAIIGMAAFAAIVFWAAKSRRNNRSVFFSIAWFILALLPVSNLFPINAYMAEHWLYVPSIGIFMLASYGLYRLYDRDKLKPVAIGIFLCMVIFYGTLTVQQNVYWKDPITFYEKTLEYNKNNGRIYANLATEYMQAGQEERAIEVYKKAVSMMTDSAGAYNNLGITYANLARHREAVEAYSKAIELNPSFAEAYSNLGVSYSTLGESAKAIEAYKKAIDINPNYADAYNNLGSEYADPAEAITAYKKAIEINPHHANAYYNLSRAYGAIGNQEEAMKMYRRARELNPNIK